MYIRNRLSVGYKSLIEKSLSMDDITFAQKRRIKYLCDIVVQVENRYNVNKYEIDLFFIPKDENGDPIWNDGNGGLDITLMPQHIQDEYNIELDILKNEAFRLVEDENLISAMKTVGEVLNDHTVDTETPEEEEAFFEIQYYLSGAPTVAMTKMDKEDENGKI